MIRTATEFKGDMKEMAKICSISHEKNVYVLCSNSAHAIHTDPVHRPRRINAVVAPYGFKFERGRIIEQPSSATDKDQGENGEKEVKTPSKMTKKEAKTPNSQEPKTPKSNKKRKIEEAKYEDSDLDLVNEEDGSATNEEWGTEEA